HPHYRNKPDTLTHQRRVMATVEKTKKAPPQKDVTVEEQPPEPPILEPVATDDATTEENEEALEILEPKTEAKRWVIRKPPERGGKDTASSVYIQQPLGYMARNRLYGLIGRTMAQAIKVSGGVGDIGDIFGMGSGSIKERAAILSQSDFADASQFFTL